MIAIYTLSNGEQIIGEWKDGDDRATVIGDPFYIVETQDEYGNNGMKLINVCTFSTQQYIVVDNTNVVFSMPANKPMTRYYNKLVEVSQKADTYKMIEDSIRDMEDMEATLRETISKRLVGGSTIN
jgi:hypothetical protein